MSEVKVLSFGEDLGEANIKKNFLNPLSPLAGDRVDQRSVVGVSKFAFIPTLLSPNNNIFNSLTLLLIYNEENIAVCPAKLIHRTRYGADTHHNLRGR